FDFKDVLVISRRVVPRYADLTPEEACDMFQSAQKIGRVIEREYNGSSLTVAIQDGPAAGQTVPHCHVHIIPRKVGDWANNDDIYKEIDKLKLGKIYQANENSTLFKIDNEERKPRSPEEMAKEAEFLRQFFEQSEM
ncbi:6618_t:CDS:2, partial [Ambispora gerdemannii]